MESFSTVADTFSFKTNALGYMKVRAEGLDTLKSFCVGVSHFCGSICRFRWREARVFQIVCMGVSLNPITPVQPLY